MSKHLIARPPLSPTFDLPLQESLLLLKPGDLIKLIFTDKNGENGERMWATITKNKAKDLWIGKLNNEPFGKELKLTLGDTVKFHPLNIIDVIYKK